MGRETAIGWTDHTFNAWIGCKEAGPGCDCCYARELDRKYQWGVPAEQAAANRAAGVAPHWGDGAPRYRTSARNWSEVIRWNAAAQARGVPAKVFCNSLSDVFDNEVPAEWRRDLFALWRETPWLRWQPVTKRAPNIKKMLPPDWGDGYPNVGLVITTVNQREFDRDAPRLLSVPARWHGFSLEPQIGYIDPTKVCGAHAGPLWFITGGESDQERGRPERKLPEPRVYDPHWAVMLEIDCAEARARGQSWHLFVKQMGARPLGVSWPKDGMGKDPAEWNALVRVQAFVPELTR